MEQWKDIKGFEGLYQVSDLGRVKSLKFGKERILSAGKDSYGYLQVDLWKDGNHKHHLVHRLVAEAFIANPDNLPQVNHRDECKTNNIVTNLEYCDRIYNCNFGTRNERMVKALSNLVYQYSKDGSLIRSYPSTREAEHRTGYNRGHISECCNGKRKQAYGFIWSYTPLTPKGQLF